jgi:magnesium chelatase family protein
MSSRAYSAILQGLEPTIIEVEVDQTDGLPILILIGLATHAVAEAKERITTALQSSGVRFKHRRTVVNLAPTDIKKSSPALDMAILAALLKQNGLIKDELNRYLFLGEIALDGSIKCIRGALPIVWRARSLGFDTVFLPKENVHEVQLVEDVTLVACHDLKQVLAMLNHQLPLAIARGTPTLPSQPKPPSDPFATIIGQPTAKRALHIAAAGGHHLLMIGPPGSGKTKLAQSLAQLLPPLTRQESLETTAIHSITQNTTQPLTDRPFRSPHHSVSHIGLLGGGVHLIPGEISLAHHGILFLDELTEFNRSALEAIRQPIEEKQITITRAHGTVRYPANFTLIAACNPCPCGFYGSQQKKCHCPPSVQKKYLSKISGPLLDRIDLVVWMEPTASLLVNDATITQHQADGQTIASTRHTLTRKPYSDNPLPWLRTQLSKSATCTLTRAEQKLALSSRGVIKTLKVAHTISTIENSTLIKENHVLEALQYRWNPN